MLPGGLRLRLDYFGLGSSDDTITCSTSSRFLVYVLFVLIPAPQFLAFVYSCQICQANRTNPYRHNHTLSSTGTRALTPALFHPSLIHTSTIIIMHNPFRARHRRATCTHPPDALLCTPLRLSATTFTAQVLVAFHCSRPK